VACTCNYSDKPFAFKANSFLGKAEPVEYIPGSGREPLDPCLISGDDNVAVIIVQTSEPTELEMSGWQPQSVPEAATSLCASTLTAMPLAQVAELAPS